MNLKIGNFPLVMESVFAICHTWKLFLSNHSCHSANKKEETRYSIYNFHQLIVTKKYEFPTSEQLIYLR